MPAKNPPNHHNLNFQDLKYSPKYKQYKQSPINFPKYSSTLDSNRFQSSMEKSHKYLKTIIIDSLLSSRSPTRCRREGAIYLCQRCVEPTFRQRDPLFSSLDTRYPGGTRELEEQENMQEALIHHRRSALARYGHT